MFTTAFENTLHCTEILFSPPAECMSVVFLLEWTEAFKLLPSPVKLQDTKTWTNATCDYILVADHFFLEPVVFTIKISV